MTTRSKWIWIAVCLLGFAAIKAASLFWWQQKNAAQTPPQAAAKDKVILGITGVCDASKNACEFEPNQYFELIGVRTNNTPFAAKITGLPENVQKVSLSFSMLAMDMGFNRFDLQKQSDKTWVVSPIYLPFCGDDRIWRVTWTIDGKSYYSDFETLP